MMRNYPYVIASYLTIVFPAVFLLGGTVPEITMDIIASLFLVRSFIEKDWRWCRHRWVQCLGILWIYMSVRSLFVPHMKESIIHSILFVRYFVFAAALAFWAFTDKGVQSRFIKVLTAVIVFMLADGLLQYFSGHDIARYPYFINTVGQIRLSSTFRKPILGIMTTWLAFPMLLSLLAVDSSVPLSRKRVLIVFVLSVLSLVVVSLSGERMALLLMLFGWGIALLLMSGYRMKVLALLVAGCIAVAATARLEPQVLQRQEGATVQVMTNWWDSPYGILLKTDLKLAEINPVFGLGTYQFRIVCPTLYPGMDEETLKFVCNIHPHNIYLEWLIENGVIGIGLFLVFLGLVFRQCVVNWPQAGKNPLFIGFLIAFILRVWPIASTTGLMSRWGASPFWLMLGCMLACMITRERETLADHPH